MHGGELRAQHLDGDLAAVLEVLGEIDRRHAALAELPLDAVAVGQGYLEAIMDLGHPRLRWGESRKDVRGGAEELGGHQLATNTGERNIWPLPRNPNTHDNGVWIAWPSCSGA